MEDLILKIEKLHKSFGEKVILDDLNINITRNTSQVIIGGSGTGKSVLIKCILGLIQQDQGIISYDNTPLNRDTRKEINFYNYNILKSPYFFTENNVSSIIFDQNEFKIYSPPKSRMCWASKTPCSYYKKIKVKKFLGLRVVYRDDW